MALFKYQFNDGGRAKAGFRKRFAGDCGARAAAIVTGKPYGEVWDQATRSIRRFRFGKPTADGGIDTFELMDCLGELGVRWETTRFKMGDNVKMVRESIPEDDHFYIVLMSHHYTVVRNGWIYDTWNPGRTGRKKIKALYKIIPPS